MTTETRQGRRLFTRPKRNAAVGADNSGASTELSDFIQENALLLGFNKYAQWIGREQYLAKILPQRSYDEEPTIRAFVQKMDM